jgi:hypothetical protein
METKYYANSCITDATSKQRIPLKHFGSPYTSSSNQVNARSVELPPPHKKGARNWSDQVP